MSLPAFLDRFPRIADRTAISSLFLTAVRQGATSPAVVVRTVREIIAHRQRLPLAEPSDRLLRILAALDEHTAEAEDLARWALAWDRRPDVQDKVGGLPATEAQLGWLRRRGVSTVPGTRRDASRLIDELVNARR